MTRMAKAMIALATLLRLWLAVLPEPLWYDEAFSVAVARLPLARMIAATAGDVHPPGYYVALKAWMQAAPVPVPMEAAARLLSVVLSLVALWLYWQLLTAWELPQRRKEAATVIAAWLPGLVFYSAEARSYTLLSVWVLGALLLASKTATWRLIGAGACLGLAALTHNVGLIYAVLIAAWVTLRLRARPLYAVACVGIMAGSAFLVWLPWGEAFASQQAAVGAGYWTHLPGFDTVAYAILRALAPVGALSTPWPGMELIYVFLAGLTTWAVVQRGRRADITLLAVGMPVLLFVLSYVAGAGLVLYRVLIPALYFVPLLWLPVLERRDVGQPLAVILTVALLVVNANYAIDGRHHQTFDDLAQIEPREGDIVYSIGSMAVPMAVYGPDLPMYAIPTAGPLGSDLSAATLSAMGVQQAHLEEIAGWERAWVFWYDDMPAVSEQDLAYFETLPDRYPTRVIADSEIKGELHGQVVYSGGLWLLTSAR